VGRDLISKEQRNIAPLRERKKGAAGPEGGGQELEEKCIVVNPRGMSSSKKKDRKVLFADAIEKKKDSRPTGSVGTKGGIQETI